MRLFRHSWWQHLDYRVKVATTQENKPPTPRHPSVDFYHSPVAVWVNSAPQPKRWGFRAHRGSKAWSSSGCILSARQPIPGKNFTTKNFFDQFCHQCTATPAPSQGLPPRFLTRFSSSRLLSNIISTGTVGEFLATATPCLAWRYRLLTR